MEEYQIILLDGELAFVASVSEREVVVVAPLASPVTVP